MTITLPEPDGTAIEVPREIHSAVKALGSDERHAAALQWIINVLSGRHRISFVAGVPNASQTMMWFEGRRFVGEMIARLIERPVPEEEPPEPPARTMTERVRRRAAKEANEE